MKPTRLLYTTSFAKSSGLANRFQVMAMAKAFLNSLGENFYFGAADFEDPNKKIKVQNFGAAKSFSLAFKVLKFCREEKITHIFCREPRLLFFIFVWNWFLRINIKVIYEIHELAHEDRPRQKFFEKFLAGRTDLNVLLTQKMAEEYSKKYKISDKKIIVLSDAVDLEIFDIPADKMEMRKKYNLPIDKKIIGYFGRFKTMNMDKGVSDILKALTKLPPDIVFLAMGGKRRDRDEYGIQAKELGILDKVIFVEQFEQEILAEYQKAVDILLMPFPWTTHFAYYMSPLKMFEYMATKRPIVATNLLAIREVLDENTAVFIPPENPERLSEAIQFLLDHPDHGKRLAESAYNKVKYYSWQKRTEKILEFVKKANKNDKSS